MLKHTGECRDAIQPDGDYFVSEDKAAVKTIMVVVAARLYREGIERTLQRENRIVLAGSETLEEAWQRLRGKSYPNLFIVQIENDSGRDSLFSLIGKMRAELPLSRWIVLSSRSDRQFLTAAIEAGVDDCLLEDVSGEILCSFADLVLLGHSFMRSQLAHWLVDADYHVSQPHHLTAKTSAFASEALIGKGTAIPLTGVTQSDVMQLTGPAQPSASDIWSTGVPRSADVSGKSPAGLPQSDTVVASLGLPRSGGASEAWSREDEPATRPSLSPARLPDPILSDREQAILTLLVEGHANKIIARSLSIAEATVKVHVKALFRKMRVINRTQAAIAAPRYLKPNVEEIPRSLTPPLEAQDAIMLPVKNGVISRAERLSNSDSSCLACNG